MFDTLHTVDEFYGDLDCKRGEVRLAKRLAVVEVGRNVCFGGGKGGGSAPKPDPQIGQAALENAELGREFLDFTKTSYAESTRRQEDLDALNKRVVEQQMGIAEQQNQWATEDRARYKDVFQPLEDEFIDEASNYASPERQAQAAAEAKADVQRNADMARAQTQRNQASMGINPRSGRFAATDRAAELETALAGAGAQNQARTAVRDKGLALKADVANLGRGLPAQSAQATSLGLNAGNSAIGNQTQTNQMSNSNSAIVGQGYNTAMQGLQSQAGILNNLYGNQLNAWQAQQQSAGDMFGGVGSLLGGAAGLYSAISSKKLKEDKRPAKDGLDAVNEMPIQEYRYKKGVADEGEHVGAMAEDFHKATGKGDGQSIPLQDAIGVTMKAVQELDDKVEQAIGLGGKKTARKTSKKGK